MIDDQEQKAPMDDAALKPLKVNTRLLRRMMAGSTSAVTVDCGPSARSPSGEWMQRVAFDLPEAMLDALKAPACAVR